MTPELKENSEHYEVKPMFCGYCGHQFNLDVVNFMNHVHLCEFERAKTYGRDHGKKEGK